MAEKTLFQAEIDADLASRIAALKLGFRLSNAEIMRAALSELADRLEAMPAPFECANAEESTASK